MNSILTIFELLDNFFGISTIPDVRKLPAKRIIELGQHVIRFHQDYQPPLESEDRISSYLGGYIASSPYLLAHSDYVFSSLLYFHSSVVGDPLFKWFSNSPSVAGGWKYKDTKSGRPQIGLTKDYLEWILPWLYEVRPLVEAGIIRLVPLDQIVGNFYQERAIPLSEAIIQQIGPLHRLSSTFRPAEIPVNDNTTGLFTFAGGNAEEQIDNVLKLPINYYSRQVLIAESTGATFTAPSRWDKYLCENTLSHWAQLAHRLAIFEAVNNLRIPIARSLTPESLLNLHNDSSFPQFRSELAMMFAHLQSSVGDDNFAQLVSEYERDVLLPKLQVIQKDLSTGRIAKAIKRTPIAFFSFVQSVAISLMTGTTDLAQILGPASAKAVSELLRPITKNPEQRVKRLWASLLPSDGDLISYFAVKNKREPEVGDRLSKLNGWEIPGEPSMKISVSEGLYYVDSPKPTIIPEMVSQTKRNDPCPCGSTLKFKKCCGFP